MDARLKGPNDATSAHKQLSIRTGLGSSLNTIEMEVSKLTDFLAELSSPALDKDLCQPFPLYKQFSCPTAAETSPTYEIWGYLNVAVAFSIAVYILELVLDVRQIRLFYSSKSLPTELLDHVTDEKFRQSVAYRKDKFSLKIVEGFISILLSVAFLYAGYLPFLWDRADALAVRLGLVASDALPTSLYRESVVTWLFLGIQTVLDSVMTLPFSLYGTFVVEQRHGFNKSTLLLFFQDKLQALLLMALISAPILPGLIFIVRAGGRYFFFYVWAFLCLVSVLLLTIYPTLIAPIFNKFTPLENGEVKSAIEALASRVGFPLTQLYLVDGSRRSAHSNAYFYGFFKNKRIVLYDTLLKQVTTSEIVAILGHEIGHWKLWHTMQGFLVTQLYTFALFASFSLLSETPRLYAAFGFSFAATGDEATRGGAPVFVALMLFLQTFWGPVDKILNVLLTMNSRRNEFAADAYAVSLGHGKDLTSGLLKISIENLDNFVPDAWYSAYHYSHPPLLERMRAIEALLRKQK